MVDERAVAEALGARSDPYERYASAAAARLESDPIVGRAREAYERFLRTSHGTLPDVDPDELFVDVLYYDFVVERVLSRAERAADVALENREPSADLLGVEWGRLHDRVDPPAAVGGAVEDVVADLDLRPAGPALVRRLYGSVVSREVRLALGQYYTPRGLADLAVEGLAVDDPRTDTYLDPGCGSGVFLAACIDQKRAALAADLEPDDLVDAVTGTVAGVDLNPVAVRSAKLTYVLSLLDLLVASDRSRVAVPVYLADALGLTSDWSIPFGDDDPPTVDHLVGNPPWITWGELPEPVRDAWRERYAGRLDLVPHGGLESRLGHANDDVSVSYLWVCVHRYLAAGGDAGFVLKRGITRGPAGAAFRAGRVGDRPVAVEHVHDFGDLRPFGDEVDVDAAVFTLRADAEPTFPVPATAWSRGEGAPGYSSAAAVRSTLDRERTDLVPVGDGPASSWVRADAATRALGESAHQIRHGVKTDARDVFDVARDRLAELEPDHVYPYLRSRHVVKYGLFGHDLHLVPQRKAGQDNEARLREECPRTYEYLQSRRDALEARSSSWLDRGPFYSAFGLGEYTWAAYKVVWCRLGFKPHFAVVSTVEDPDLGEKPVVPGDHCLFVPTDDEHEAHFLSALLNSAPYQESLSDLASGGKSSLSKSVVSNLRLPPYPGTDRSRRLADLSMEAHGIVPGYTDVSKRAYNRTTIPELEAVQAQIDDLVEGMLVEGVLEAGDRRPPSE